MTRPPPWNCSLRACANCDFWPLSPRDQDEWDAYAEFAKPPHGLRGHPAYTYSDCRRHAPQRDPPEPGQSRDLSGSACWPTTSWRHWCGDFTPRKRPLFREGPAGPGPRPPKGTGWKA